MHMKSIFYLFALIFLSCQNNAQTKATVLNSNEEKIMKPTIYNYQVTDINGKQFKLSDFKGKKILIVNTASECGLTPQYKDLETIYNLYKDKNFVVIGFPANNFGAQEPGTNNEIATFCTKNYGVTFPMMSKVSVKGKDMCEIYQFLTQKSKNGLQDSEVEWNFQKYLINEKGELEKVISPQTTPMSKEVLTWVMK